jgi:exosortase A
MVTDEMNTGAPQSDAPHGDLIGGESGGTLAPWKSAGAVYGVLALLCSVIMFDAVAAIYQTAMTSNTFGHILLIPFVIAWLIWNRAPELKHVKPSSAPLASLLLIGTGFVWLLGKAADIQLAQQLAYVASLQVLVLVVFGRKGLHALAFPTFFMLFLVPFGEEFVPTLQDVTAHFVVSGLNFLGIPVYTDGVFLQTPSGDFEVAEACSGIRFMVSTFALGCLFSVLCFKSWPRRVLVVVLSILIPIVANGIRAFGIVYIAYLTDNEVAVGVDHIIYGWIFFAIVTILLIVIGLTFSDRSVQDPPIDVARINAMSGNASSLSLSGAVIARVAALPALILGAYFLVNSWVEARRPEVPLARYEAAAAPQGWSLVDGSLNDRWLPNYAGADQSRLDHYTDGQRYFSIYRAGYSYERQGAELIGFGNTVAAPDDIWGWASGGSKRVTIGGRETRVQYTLLRSNFSLLRDVWQVYYVNGKVVSSPVRAKIETILARLSGGPLYTGTLVISAPRTGSRDVAGGEAVLAAIAQQLPTPERLMLVPAEGQ